MPTSVRLPQQVEQRLAEYCIVHKVTKSEAVKRALDALLDSTPGSVSSYARARHFIGSDSRPGDVARHSKRLLRERFKPG